MTLDVGRTADFAATNFLSQYSTHCFINTDPHKRWRIFWLSYIWRTGPRAAVSANWCNNADVWSSFCVLMLVWSLWGNAVFPWWNFKICCLGFIPENDRGSMNLREKNGSSASLYPHISKICICLSHKQTAPTTLTLRMTSSYPWMNEEPAASGTEDPVDMSKTSASWTFELQNRRQEKEDNISR